MTAIDTYMTHEGIFASLDVIIIDYNYYIHIFSYVSYCLSEIVCV